MGSFVEPLSEDGLPAGASASAGGLPGRRFSTGRSSDENGSWDESGSNPCAPCSVDEGTTVSGFVSRKLSIDSAGTCT